MSDKALYSKNILGKKAFAKLALTTAAPIMIENLIGTLVGSADTIMLGYVSQDAMSASALANQMLSILWCAFFGLTAAASVMASQYWGKRDTETIERVLGLAVRISIIITFVFFAIAFFFPDVVMRIFTNEPAIIEEGIKYLRIIAFSYLFMSFSQVYLCVLRSTERLLLPSITYIISLCVNVLLNATFIFGLFGAPKLGLVGVAVGTVVARMTECIICIVHAMTNKVIKFRIKYVFAKTGVLFKDFVKVGAPAMANDVVWSLANAVFAMIMGRLGSDAVAANSVAVMAVNIGAIVCRGFASATTVIVSRPLGDNNKEAAKVYAGRMFYITTAVALAGGVIIWFLRPLMISMYDGKLTDNALTLIGQMLPMLIVRLIGEAINTWMICGCFRGGGDSKFGLILDSIFMWLVAVPLMAIAAFVIKLPPIWVYLVMCLDEWYKMAPSAIHYRKFNWLKNITREKDELNA